MALTRVVDARGRIGWAEPPPPAACPNGHALVPPVVRVGHQPCGCAPGGHRYFLSAYYLMCRSEYDLTCR